MPIPPTIIIAASAASSTQSGASAQTPSSQQAQAAGQPLTVLPPPMKGAPISYVSIPIGTLVPAKAHSKYKGVDTRPGPSFRQMSNSDLKYAANARITSKSFYMSWILDEPSTNLNIASSQTPLEKYQLVTKDGDGLPVPFDLSASTTTPGSYVLILMLQTSLSGPIELTLTRKAPPISGPGNAGAPNSYYSSSTATYKVHFVSRP